ncbi:MAG: NAD-dependent epimerase/dehydratase family protein [Syntrophales bacterium]
MIDEEVLNSFSGKNVLVTGGTGLIGRQIVHILYDSGACIKSVSLDDVTLHEKIHHVRADLRDYRFCQDIMKDMDFVFHVAGIKGSVTMTVEKPASHFVPALMFNTNVLEASRINNVKRLVFTSSIGAYSSAEVFTEKAEDEGPPMDFYGGWAKRMAEYQIRAYGIQYGMKNFAIVRPCNVYGPGDNFDPVNAMVIPSLMYRVALKEDPVVVWGDGSAIRDFAFSRDVAEGCILALYHGTRGSYVNLGSGYGVKISELVKILASFLKFNFVFDTTKPAGYPKRVMDISLARKLIGYNPSTSLLEGLKETWNWFQENRDEHLKKKNYWKE